MITSSGLPARDAKSSAFLESVTTCTTLPGFDGGMIPWLGRFHRIVHSELTGALPDRIQRAWERGDLSDFVDALAQFEDMFADAVKIYRDSKEHQNV